MMRVSLISLGLFVCMPSQVSAAFEVLGRAATSSAMAGACVVHADDASAPWHNAAGLAAGSESELGVEFARLYPGLDVGPDLNNWAINYARGIAGGRLGVGVAGLDAGFYSENAVMLSYGRGLTPALSVGLGARLLRWSADGYSDPVSGMSDADFSGSGVGIDVGLRYDLFRWQEGQVALGFSGRSLNEPDVSDSGGTGIPRTLAFGLGYEDVLVSTEVDIEFVDGDRILRLGGEYKLGGAYDLRIRFGGSGLPGEGTAGSLDGGLGLRRGRLLLNYGYHYSGEIDAGGHQQISLGYRF